jgi:hypothetical protein
MFNAYYENITLEQPLSIKFPADFDYSGWGLGIGAPIFFGERVSIGYRVTRNSWHPENGDINRFNPRKSIPRARMPDLKSWRQTGLWFDIEYDVKSFLSVDSTFGLVRDSGAFGMLSKETVVNAKIQCVWRIGKSITLSVPCFEAYRVLGNVQVGRPRDSGLLGARISFAIP